MEIIALSHTTQLFRVFENERIVKINPLKEAIRFLSQRELIGQKIGLELPGPVEWIYARDAEFREYKRNSGKDPAQDRAFITRMGFETHDDIQFIAKQYHFIAGLLRYIQRRGGIPFNVDNMKLAARQIKVNREIYRLTKKVQDGTIAREEIGRLLKLDKEFNRLNWLRTVHMVREGRRKNATISVMGAGHGHEIRIIMGKYPDLHLMRPDHTLYEEWDIRAAQEFERMLQKPGRRERLQRLIRGRRK